MDIQEQINLAAKAKLGTSSIEEIEETIRTAVKLKFNIKNQEEIDNETIVRRNTINEIGCQTFKLYLEQGMDEETAREKALRYAFNFWKQTQLKLNENPAIWCIWSIESGVPHTIEKVIEGINSEYNREIRLYTYDAHAVMGKKKYISLQETIKSIQTYPHNSILLITNCAWTNKETALDIYNAVRYPDSSNPYIILTSPLVLPEGEKNVWERSMPLSHTVMLEE